ncbi:MAG: TolC family protein [Gammaproteobacteria bacterium]|nr:TolC family protein [Gammaproteobacteria bacterium]MBU1468658.1 TolC family protein [Gammaproteobacteria bacterium]MBU2021954.1 TolC family protein [Gammaproteobacteria bacterium]MBU2237821.1 TolC family protein [Gammaproteobacteria bacterium]MBU2320363.1 TolC family protein [Gammaproteobacteria bacterium]
MMVGKKIAVLLGSGLLMGSVNAEPVVLDSELARLLQEHALISQADKEIFSAKQQMEAAQSAWFPTLTVSGLYGREHIDRDIGNDTKMTKSELDASLRQTLWDFGKTSGAITKAEKTVTRKELERDLQSQNLLLAGLEAYINLKKAYRVAEFARQSEENIKQQTNLEDTRINNGKGYTTDVLQAKAQLAGARAKRVSAEQVLSTAKNRYVTVFNTSVPSDADMAMLTIPAALLPSDIDDLISNVVLNNPDVRRDQASVAVATAEKERVKSNQWMPSLDLVASTQNHRNQDGVSGDRYDNEISVQFNWNINLAGQANHQVKSAAADEAAQQYQADYTLLTAKETAENAWSDLILAKERAGYLQDQAEIAGQFLELARKERELGRRSLIDVLSGETSLINAQSDYSAAQADVVIASYNIVRSMGKLTLENVKDL